MQVLNLQLGRFGENRFDRFPRESELARICAFPQDTISFNQVYPLLLFLGEVQHLRNLHNFNFYRYLNQSFRPRFFSQVNQPGFSLFAFPQDTIAFNYVYPLNYSFLERQVQHLRNLHNFNFPLFESFIQAKFFQYRKTKFTGFVNRNSITIISFNFRAPLFQKPVNSKYIISSNPSLVVRVKEAVIQQQILQKIS